MTPLQILLVEDNPLDVRATLKAAAQLTVDHRIEVVTDGERAIERLTRMLPPIPDLVLLDLDLPGTNGYDVLTTIKTSPDLRRMPVVILTTSDDEADVIGAYNRGANAYLTKPATLEGWQRIVDQIQSFWLSLVTLPPS